MLTTTATDELGRIHDRMPLLVERDRYAEWLDPAVDDADQLRGLLVPAAPGRLTAYPVATDREQRAEQRPGAGRAAAGRGRRRKAGESGDDELQLF